MRVASKRLSGLLALLLALGGLPLRAQEARPRIAVLQFQRAGAQEAEAAATADQLRTELVNLGAFTVLERTQTEAVLGELAFQQEGFTDPSRATQAGQLLNVEYVVTGRVTRLQGAYQVNAQMTDVKTGEIVRSESALHRGDFVGLLSAQIPRLAARLAGVKTAPPPIAQSPPPPVQGVTPERSPAPPIRGDAPRRWPMMGMMGGGMAAWPLVVGGAMVMGAAMMAGHADSDNREAALAVGAVGVGLIAYHLIAGGTKPAAASAQVELHLTRPVLHVELGRQAARAGITWRW